MFEHYTDRGRRVIVLAQEEARAIDHNYIGTEHLLLGLVHEGEGVAAKALESLDISLAQVRQQVEEIIGRGQQAPSGHIPFTPRSKQVLRQALLEALHLGHNYIGTEHIILGLIREGQGVAAQVLLRLGFDLNSLRSAVIEVLRDVQGNNGQWPLDPPFRNLTLAAQAGLLGPVVGRQQEIYDVVAILASRSGNPLLVGEPGVGVSSVVHGVAQAMSQPQSPQSLAGTQVRQPDLSIAFVSGANFPAEEVSQSLRDDICDAGELVLFLDHARAAVGEPDSSPAPSDLLRPMLLSGEVHAIATATPAEQRQWAAADQELYQLFRPVVIDELSEGAAVQVLAEYRERYEARHQVAITDAAITAAVTLSVQHMPDQPLPGKAITLIDRAAAQAGRQEPLRRGDLALRLAAARVSKDAAIDAQDFTAVARFRSEEKELLASEVAWAAEWKNTPAHRIRSVTAEDVAEALAGGN